MFYQNDKYIFDTKLKSVGVYFHSKEIISVINDAFTDEKNKTFVFQPSPTLPKLIVTSIIINIHV